MCWHTVVLRVVHKQLGTFANHDAEGICLNEMQCKMVL